MTRPATPKFHSPRATRDYLPDEAAARNHVRWRFAEVAESYGFRAIETPSFENVELFSVHSGPEIKSSMLTFHCDHEEFALRPEMTAPVCRLVGSSTLEGLPRPYKFSYLGSCFRYCPPRSGRYREFTQAGMECLGAPGPAADAEVIGAACRILRSLGITDYQLKIGSIGIFGALLSADLDPEDHATVIGHLDNLLSIHERCRVLAESGAPSLFDELKVDRMELAGLQADADYSGPHAIASRPDVSPEELAERLPREAEATFRRVWSVQELVPETVSDLLLKVSDLRGPLREVHTRAQALLEGTQATEALDRLLRVCRKVEMYETGEFEVVLGIARGFTFYTSTVFEITAESGGEKYCGGGRYDRLVEEFGGSPLPSTGCAFRFDTLVEAFTRSTNWTPPRAYQLYLLAATEEELPEAIRFAEALREKGLRVGVDVEALGKPSTDDARRRGTDWLALLQSSGREAVLRLSDGSSVQELPANADALAARLKNTM